MRKSFSLIQTQSLMADIAYSFTDIKYYFVFDISNLISDIGNLGLHKYMYMHFDIP